MTRWSRDWTPCSSDCTSPPCASWTRTPFRPAVDPWTKHHISFLQWSELARESRTAENSAVLSSSWSADVRCLTCASDICSLRGLSVKTARAPRHVIASCRVGGPAWRGGGSLGQGWRGVPHNNDNDTYMTPSGRPGLQTRAAWKHGRFFSRCEYHLNKHVREVTYVCISGCCIIRSTLKKNRSCHSQFYTKSQWLDDDHQRCRNAAQKSIKTWSFFARSCLNQDAPFLHDEQGPQHGEYCAGENCKHLTPLIPAK